MRKPLSVFLRFRGYFRVQEEEEVVIVFLVAAPMVSSIPIAVVSLLTAFYRIMSLVSNSHGLLGKEVTWLFFQPLAPTIL